jgi:hypothetical protein
LHIISDGDRVERRQAATDAHGRYRFDGLDATPDLKYLPVVEYGGVTYYPRPVSLADQPNQTADITVYDSTTSDELILYERSNLMVRSVSAGRMDVMEMGAITNAGDRTYVGREAAAGDRRETLNFSVPAGASELTPQLGFVPADISLTPDGFTVSTPVLPGRHQLAFSYSFPFSAERMSLNKRLEYPTASFNLYVPDTGLRIDSSELAPQGHADLGGQRFLLYSAQNLRRGTELSVQLNGLPSTAEPLSTRLAWPILVAGSSVLLVGLGVSYRRRPTPTLRIPNRATASRHSEHAPGTNGHGEAHRAELERMELLLSLARLDERYARGELPDAQYRHEREVGKRRLIAYRQQPEADPAAD